MKKPTPQKPPIETQTPMERWHRLKENFIRESDAILDALNEKRYYGWKAEMIGIAVILEIGDAEELNRDRSAPRNPFRKVPLSRLPEMFDAFTRGDLLKVMAGDFGIQPSAISTACRRAGLPARNASHKRKEP